MVTGAVTPTEFGARVAMTIRMNVAYAGAIALFLCGLCVLANPLRPGWVLVTFALLYVAQIVEAGRAESLLRTLFLPAPSEPVSSSSPFAGRGARSGHR